MLFFNFLCLFYLMVLINSHTISKNIAHDDTIDDIVDSIQDFDYRREYKPRHDRIHRYCRKEEKEDAAKVKEKEGERTQSTAAKLVSDSTEVTKLAKTANRITKSTKHSGFWHKFRYRGNEKKSKGQKKQNDLYKRKAMPRRRVYRKQQYMQSHADYRDFNYDSTTLYGRRSPRLERNRHTNADKRKRDVSNITTTVNSLSTRVSSIFNPLNSKSTSLFKFKTYEPLRFTDNLTKDLTALTTQIDNLKKEYGLKMKTSSYPTFTTQSMMKNISTVSSSIATSTQTTTEDVDFLGTAQIEALLNDIKVKAVQMVAEQSPAVTDIITNTVTETTFEADPILTHITGSPGYALSTFISIDNYSPFSKRTVTVNTATGLRGNDTVVIANTELTHHVTVRSINEDVFTIAQTIEDMLQKKLKKVYKKVKGKMSSQLNQETHNAKTTIKKETDKIMKKITHSDKKQSATSVTKPMTTPNIKSRGNTKRRKGSTLKQVRRSPKHGKNEKNKVKTTSASTQSTFDDYAMLTLFEQILTKTHEDNVMKMLTTSNVASKNREHFKLFKRNPVTLTRVSLKENQQKLYDEVILPDDLADYGSKTTNPYSVSTQSEAEDSSYEGLSNKISYNDYVNGYKHYLKFQKEQGNQNFSNLVRYQAHRHHSVDDIGKFILNKIPQLPGQRLKRFFDDDTMDDQDVSTKSDDSWFKKHFYLFIDNGPPRKFHTSQTVELKSPITDSDLGSSGTENPVITSRPKSQGLTENVESFEESDNANQDAVEDSLEQLSKALDEQKSKEFISDMPGQVNNFNNDAKIEEALNKVNSPENSILRGFGSIGLVDKFFRGKGRRTPKHKVNTEEQSETFRKKRSTKIHFQDIDNLYTSQRNSLRSTVPNAIETRNKNYGYVDVNLIPRPTAIVKLRENKQKKGKLKHFFEKFRFRKRNKHKEIKKSERTKREYRIQRFSPLKKLKEIFKVKQIDKPAQTLEMPDYDMMTSHIDTFKPIKYDKVMSVEEIKGQIPNITEDLSHFHHDEFMKPIEKPISMEEPNLSPVDAPEIYDASPEVVTTPSFSELDGSLKTSTRKHPKLKPNMKHLSTFKPLKDSGSSVDMPEITYDPSTNKFEMNNAMTPSLDAIRSEIDSLQMKLSMPDEKPESTTSSKSLSTTRYTNNFSAKKIYVPAHIQAVQTQPKIKAKADPKDIKIQTKLTRIAKFPLSRFSHDHRAKINPSIEKPQIYEYTNEDTSSNDKIFIDFSPEKRIWKRSLNTYVTVSPRYPPSQKIYDFNKVDGYNKPYPDYFNDLLMWHGDLLNTERLTSPRWENILKNLKQDTEVSTLSMMDMQRELMQMKEYLRIDESLKSKKTPARMKSKAKLPIKLKKDKTRSNTKKAQNIIKTVALKDNTVAKGNDIIIEGEAKYFHLIKQPEPESEKYIKAADLLNDLNKIYFKSPAIKYNIEDKIHDTKRNGEFWLGNTEPTTKNSIEQDSSSVLFLDTTLLAYDDGPDFLTDRPKHKKMTKNFPTSSNLHQNQASPKPVAKTNQSPAQYFSTPLPMRMNDFDRFLKENQLDVQSVTTPLIGMPQFVVNKTPAKAITKKQEYQPNNAKLAKATSMTPMAFVTTNPINYSSQKIENNKLDPFTIKDTYVNKYKNVDDIRQKRYSEIRNERFFTFEPFRKKSKAGKVKKKIKLFDKQASTAATTTVSDIRYTVISPQIDDDNTQKEVELTIINMNDIDQGYDSKQVKPDERIKTEKPKHITTREQVNTEKSFTQTKTTKDVDEAFVTSYPLIKKIHNNLLYNHKHKDKYKEPIFKPMVIPQVFNFDGSVVTDDISTTTFHPFINNELFKNLHAKHPPKRVRISSHSYKYDVIYHDPKRLSKNAHKYDDDRYTPVPNYNNEEWKSPYNSDLKTALSITIRTSDRKHEIVKIVRAVEAIDNYTRPNVEIHVNLPTYYMPETGPTEKIEIAPTPKRIWNDFVMKYLSGLALMELLNKFGILNVNDWKMDLTDGVDKAVNASKVFSIAEHTAVDKEMKWRTKSRVNRQASDYQSRPNESIYSYEGSETMVPNWREKRRLKLFSNIKGKLKTLLTKKKPTTTISPKVKTPKTEDKDTTAPKLSTFEDQKAKREENDELNGRGISTVDDGFNVDYDFDIDRIVERATADSGTTKKLEAKTKEEKKQEYKDLMSSDDDIPYLSPTMNEEIPTIKDNITPTSLNDSSKQTNSITSTTTTTAKNEPLSSLATPKATPKEKVNHNFKEEVYFEPIIYDNKIYYEPGSSTPKPSNHHETPKTKENPKLKTKPAETKLEKRDIQPASKFTARDVAALEVIVDLVKNTVNYEERDAPQEYTENYYQNHPAITSSPILKSTVGSNSIQVHIAIPYNLQVDKKRSLDSFKVRRVFAAKMFSPVDLEYQVQSFEDNKQTTSTTVNIPEDFMTPKMYLLIDANGSLAKGNFPLRPLKGNIDLSKVRVRQVATTKVFATQKAETTSGKSISRVTLSKDFVSAVNKHLVQLYENLTALNDSSPQHHVQVRETNIFNGPKNIISAAKTSYRRHINWETVKKYFGHDRVCNCKCKPNRTMCRACAASDAVISELIFEFDNLAKYMNDHCTEIQTFFWMNPSGGKKLRDTVHKVDQTLHDYFKRVKGKCQGRTCKTFSTCIDKRSFVKQKKIPKKYIGDPLILDLQRLAYDIETTSKLGICYSDNLVEGGEMFINTVGNCIRDVSKKVKSTQVTTTTTTTTTLLASSTKKPMAKNIYSLDNINVNIICKPESKVAIASSTAKLFSLTPEASLISELNLLPNSNFYDYDTDHIKYKKRKGFRNFFANKRVGKYKMNHIFTYYVTKDPDVTTPMRIFKKRQIANQIESPLVSDTGGTFWRDYLRGKSLPHEQTTTTNKNLITIDPTAQKSSKNDADTSAKNINKIKRSTSPVNERELSTTANPYPEKHVFQRNINTTDYSSLDTLSHNINELFKIFHNLTDLKEIENMSTQTFELTEKHTTIKPKHTKATKTTKIFKSIKAKLHFKHKPNSTKSDMKIHKATPKTLPTVETKDDSGSIPTSDAIFSSKSTTSEVPNTLTETTKKSTTAKIKTTKKSATLKYTTNHNAESSVSESTTQETSSITEPSEDVNVKATDDSQKITEKHSKSNFFNKFKMATLDFFHNKAKEMRKTTAIGDTKEEIRKSRSPATESINLPNLITKHDENPSLDKLDNSTNVISEATTDKNPMILIINDYGTEMDPDFGTTESEKFEDLNKNSSTVLNENFRNLLMSIINFEAEKLSNEWRRIKKDGNCPVDETQNSKRGIFSLYHKKEGAVTSKNYENDYDILKTLKDLELPTPKGLDTEKKGSGLLQKIVNKFGVRVVPNTQKEKPKVTCTKLPVSQLTSKMSQITTRRQKTKLPTNTEKNKDGNSPETAKLKSKPKIYKLNPKYTSIPHPTVTVNVYGNQEASKSHSGQVCDIDATFKQVQEMLQLLPRKDVEKYITNKTCAKYKKLPKYFLIDVSHRKRKSKFKNNKQGISTQNILRWDWIRNKRSLNYKGKDTSASDNAKVIAKEVIKSNVDDKVNTILNRHRLEHLHETSENTTPNNKIAISNHKNGTVNKQILDSKDDNDVKHDITNFVIEGSDYFEELERDEYGIYRSRKKRNKRENDITELETGLKNLPFLSRPNESYAMLGDSVIIKCSTNKINARKDTNDFRWITDREGMLQYDNVIVNGPELMIKVVEARNLGDYTCQKGNRAQRKIRLTIITLPTFKVVFTPIYSVDGKCTYEDLKAVRSLGPAMSKEVCSEDRLCTVRIDEPVCLRDRVSNTAYLRLTAVMSIPPNEDVQCSGRCRRDLHDSLVLMAAANAPGLASVEVIIKNDDADKTLVPSASSDGRRTIITHTLRRKDSINHRDYYSHTFSSERVNVITSCPAGYYLLQDQKICAACPFGSWAYDGDNACSAESPTRANRHGDGGRFRRCYWWCGGCGWAAAGWGAACACAGAAALLHARGAKTGTTNVGTARAPTPRARPLSPSRVILAKFFRGSRSSTKATDSQETKFGLWKEKNLPPPLPPIDFDL